MGRQYGLSEIEYMFSRVQKDESTGCWNWTGDIINGRYGRVRVSGCSTKNKLAHRYMYELINGGIEDGLVIDHVCLNKRCVNPDHLEPVTTRENNIRASRYTVYQNSTKTECPKGHPYSDENTYINVSTGGRHCRICSSEHKKRWKDKKRKGLT